MDTMIFLICLVVFTAINAFFVFLRTPPESLRQTGTTLRRFWIGTLLRIALAALLIFAVRQPIAIAAGLFLLVPPTMAAPTLALMWGGDYFVSVQLTLGLSLFAPVPLIAAAVIGHAVGLPVTVDLKPFLVVFALGVVVPAIVAQHFRRRRAIQAGAMSTNWSWIGGAALIPLACCAGFYFFTPPVIEAFATASGRAALVGDVAIAVALLITIRLCGTVANYFAGMTEQQRIDGYLCSIAPNIFFWCSITNRQFGGFSVILVTLYFLSLWLEDRRFVHRYAQAIAKRLQLGPSASLT